MSTTLDDLLSALETALTNTQETLRRRNNEIETGISHRDDFLVSESGHGEPFSLPEATLRARRRHQVSMLSLSCECRLRRTRPSLGHRLPPARHGKKKPCAPAGLLANTPEN